MAPTSSSTQDRWPKTRAVTGSSQPTKTVSLIPGQSDLLGANSVESVREGPLWLFFRDCFTFFCMLKYFPTIFLPFWTNDPSDEFYLKSWNLFGLAVLTFGSIIQFVLILAAIPAMLLLPGAFGIIVLVVGTMLIKFIFFWVQGMELTRWSEDPKDSKALKIQRSHSTERWMFLNGCCVTGDMLQQNLNLISKTFGRQVFAVHNRTYGIVGDVLECIIQRSFRFYSQETRCAYQYVKSYCADPDVTKVVLIGHSQGGIMTSEILDQLYQDLPSECIAKMEVYTFGNAAIHFNNPLRRLVTAATKPANVIPLMSPLPFFSPMSPTNGSAKHTSNIVSTPISTNGTSAPIFPIPEPERVIPYIEHYCNEKDMVTRWGVLHSVTDIMNNTFCGQVFISKDTSGHMLNQHYLSKMFPLPNQNGSTSTSTSTAVPFLDSVVDVDSTTVQKHTASTAKQLGVLRTNSMPHDATVTPGSPTDIAQVAAVKRKATLELEMGDRVVLHERDLGSDAGRIAVVKTGESLKLGKTVRDCSRLWKYMGGGTPE